MAFLLDVNLLVVLAWPNRPEGFTLVFEAVRRFAHQLPAPVTTTWRLYNGSALGDRPLIAHGTGTREPVVLNEAR